MIDTRTAAYGAFLLRVSLGVLALAHGLLKIFVFTVPGTVAFFESLGYPGFFAYLVIAGEVAGGLALITGVYARVAAVALIPILIGATVQHVPNGWPFASANGGWEFPAFWTVALAAQALIGPGAFAVKAPVRLLGHRVSVADA
ncbi:MAG: DoxX family protein [Hyphomicrobiales bacterium]|nr:DoxX family protein [Hyphomicrobiales bacterium]